MLTVSPHGPRVPIQQFPHVETGNAGADVPSGYLTRPSAYSCGRGCTRQVDPPISANPIDVLRQGNGRAIAEADVSARVSRNWLHEVNSSKAPPRPSEFRAKAVNRMLYGHQMICDIGPE
jgi:hypothetical protein